MIKLVDANVEAQSFPDEWRSRYYTAECGWRVVMNGVSSEEVYNRVMALPKPYSPRDIEKIVGNNTWTRYECFECGKWVDVALCLHQTDDNYTYVPCVYVCKKCMREALERIGSENSNIQKD